MSTRGRAQIKTHLCQKRKSHKSEQAKEITQQFPEALRHAVQLASEKGAGVNVLFCPVAHRSEVVM